MSVDALLTDLACRGVRLWVDDGKLRYRAPKGAVSPEQFEELQRRKPAVIERLIKDGPLEPAFPLSLSQRIIWASQHSSRAVDPVQSTML